MALPSTRMPQNLEECSLFLKVSAVGIEGFHILFLKLYDAAYSILGQRIVWEVELTFGLQRFKQDSLGHWLLQPVRESNLQLFALISIWISSKIHDSHPLSVTKLKTMADKTIEQQHYTTRDFADAEMIFMKVLDFEIGTLNIAYWFLEDLVIHLKEVATVGYHLNFEVCMDIMDLLYEKEETSALYASPRSLAASILVASYVITVPKQTWEFPILPWDVFELLNIRNNCVTVKHEMGCKEEELVQVVKDILTHVLQPC
ncbi:hypothetical protein OSB04_019441 [Centaurea solstitialis]|uniref:Cyclin N-terminal domain-containing protein n=1 Tax=Centaurea solstitialis TaxID=347529 RepID=A0AA38SQV5_9ASTR|nr:hypothetical protein OSB04_019441 [Centaurea solstitialis]